MPDGLHPAAIFYLGALLVALTSGRLRAGIALAVPVLGALQLASLEPDLGGSWSLFGHTLHALRVDDLSLLFAWLFHLAAFIAILYSLHVKDGLLQVAGILYAGSAVGAVLAGDLVTLFAWWEMLALTSVFLVFAPRTERSFRAGMRYLIWNVLSGVVLMAGVLMVGQARGSFEFSAMSLLDGPGSWAIFLAFGIKCAFPVFHTWLVDAYPESTPAGTVFLSAFTTKTAVYALARGFPGTEALIWIGAVMTAFPIFFAVIENDLRRVLSYSMVNQIGFMVVGIGIGTELALNGAVSHAFADVIFKGLLFMAMGAVLHMTGTAKGTDLGGLYKTMPKTAALCIVGALSISAFPLFSAFITKSMVMAAALEEGHVVVWFVLLFASAGVLEHAGIKIPYFAFFAHDSGIRAAEPPRNMLLAMTLSAVLCIAIGCWPPLLYGLLPWPVDYAPYTATHVVTQLQILLLAALGVVVLIKTGIYPPELRATNLDVDWLWRRVGFRFARAVGRTVYGVQGVVTAVGRATVDVALAAARHGHGPGGVFARTVPVGTSVLFAAVMLAIYLLLYYF